jgi:Na+/proline symporter
VLFALFAFVLVQLGVGLWAVRRIRSADDFLLAGRGLGPVLAATSIFATWFGAESCMGSAGSAYAAGFSLHNPEPFAYGLCLVFTGLFFAARLWDRGITTIADFLRLRYGSSTERLAAILLVPTSLLWAAAQVRAFGHVVAVNSDGLVSLQVGIAIAAAIAIAYTVAGGLLADVYTDVIQLGALLLGLGTLAIAVYANLPAPGAAAAPAPAPDDAGPDVSLATAWVGTLEAWAIPICGSVVAQEVLSRTLAARSARLARRAAVTAGAAYVLIGIVPLWIGVVGPSLAPGLEDPEGILPHLSQELLPAALNVLFAGALIAAILSTVDSCLLVVASLVGRNVLPRAADGRAQLRLLRLVVVAGGLAAFGLASTGLDVRDLVEEASGFGSAGVFVLAVIGLYGSRGRALAANAALTAGLVSWIAGRHGPALVGAEPWPWPYLTSLTCAFVGFLAGARREQKLPPPAP